VILACSRRANQRRDFLLVTGATVNASVQSLAHNDTVADATRALDRRLGAERGWIVQRRDDYLSPRLRRQELAEQPSTRTGLPLVSSRAGETFG
jgi:hypothetical protein